jgi:hypothetical protein
MEQLGICRLEFGRLQFRISFRKLAISAVSNLWLAAHKYVAMLSQVGGGFCD